MRSTFFGLLSGTLIAVAIWLLMTCTASAADYRLVDRSGNVVQAITHGTTIDLHDLLDRNYLKVEAAFENVDHASWVEFTLIHSERYFDYKRTDRTSPRRLVVRFAAGGCYPLQTGTGSVMLKSTGLVQRRSNPPRQ